MELGHTSKSLRKKVLDLYYKAHAGHIGCSLSCMDILINIYECHKQADEKFILSKGHAAAALYVVLHHRGEISNVQLESFYANGTQLPAHPAPLALDAIPFATGSLGHGLPIANGITLHNKLKQSDRFTYVLMSDGETNEGSSWEAAHFAVKHKLDHLLAVIDKNKIQGFGRTEDILGDTADAAKWRQIGFEVAEVNGHDHNALSEAILNLKASFNGKPKLIIADTIKGKGVSYMENTVDWHYWPMDEDKYKRALADIDNM